ncbi:MAG TPA: short-chain dehydrogenase [Verrucomicrobiales bacterium]|nr:short-chain dehydrogenase [Verrucomicrobiales bacterium]
MKTAVITGAGSGVGQAVAVKLVNEGWNVAIIGRRAEALQETLAKCGGDTNRVLVCTGDVGVLADVQRIAKDVLAKFGSVQALVNSAGTNIPKRKLADLSVEDYEKVMAANLNGSFYCVQAFLPSMREQKLGTIVNIVSDAGKQANPKAGTAYICSKFAQNGLTQAINLEEWEHNIRACSIFPGDINTPLLDRRPVPPPAEARKRMLQPEDLAECVWLVIALPKFVGIEEMLVRPLGNKTS